VGEYQAAFVHELCVALGELYNTRDEKKLARRAMSEYVVQHLNEPQCPRGGCWQESDYFDAKPIDQYCPWCAGYEPLRVAYHRAAHLAGGALRRCLRLGEKYRINWNEVPRG